MDFNFGAEPSLEESLEETCGRLLCSRMMMNAHYLENKEVSDQETLLKVKHLLSEITFVKWVVHIITNGF